MARSTAVAKSFPFLLTADSARWPARKGSTASSRTADAAAASAAKSMTPLLSDRVERLRQREPPGVERLAHDRAFDPLAGQCCDGAQVVETRDTAGGDHRRLGPLGDPGQQVQVGPAQGAVLGDVGDDVPGASFGVEAVQ